MPVSRSLRWQPDSSSPASGKPGAVHTVAVLPDTTALLQGDGVDLYGVAGGGGVEILGMVPT
jgi:hypothetical protein